MVARFSAVAKNARTRGYYEDMKDSKSDHTISGQIERGVKDVRDGAHEVMHRSTAEAEHTRRETEGDTMTPGEKVASGVNEAKNRVEAEGDKAKRNVRDNT